MILLLLAFGVSVGAGITAWIELKTKDRPGAITGPVVLVQSENIQSLWEQEIEKREQEKQEVLAETKSEKEEEDWEEQEADTALSIASRRTEITDAPKFRIVLDPGHGGPGIRDEQELGAIYRDTYEKYLTLEIAMAMKEELSQYGNIEVFMTRDTDRALTLKERAAYAESVDADLLVSLHLNASLEHNFYGSEVFVSAFDKYYARGAGVGESILKQLTDYGFVSKGVKTRLGSKGDYYGIIRECRSLGIPALIVSKAQG